MTPREQALADKRYRDIQRRRLTEDLHFDANETAFLERELEQVRALVLEVMYPSLKAKTFFPMAGDIAPSADTYIYKVTDKTGHARVSAKGNDDFPRVEVQATERSGRVKQTEVAYGWELNEMREAVRLGIPLQSKKALAAAEAVARLHDNLFATGADPNLGATANTALGIPGVIADTNVAIVAMLDWNDSGTDGQEMLDDLHKLARSIPDASKQVEYGDTIILPTQQYNIAATKRLNEFDNRSVLEAFLKASPWIKNVDSWLLLDEAGATGKDRAICFRRANDVVELVEPVVFEQLPPQARNAEFVVPCLGRCGGTKLYKPLAFAYGDFAGS